MEPSFLHLIIDALGDVDKEKFRLETHEHDTLHVHQVLSGETSWSRTLIKVLVESDGTAVVNGYDFSLFAVDLRDPAGFDSLIEFILGRLGATKNMSAGEFLFEGMKEQRITRDVFSSFISKTNRK